VDFRNLKASSQEHFDFALISLVSLSSLFIFATGPSYAATQNQKLIQQENMDKESQIA